MSGSRTRVQTDGDGEGKDPECVAIRDGDPGEPRGLFGDYVAVRKGPVHPRLGLMMNKGKGMGVRSTFKILTAKSDGDRKGRELFCSILDIWQHLGTLWAGTTRMDKRYG